MPKDNVEKDEGMAEHARKTRWVKKAELNRTATTAPGIVDEGKGVGPIDGDGDAGQIQPHDDDAGLEPVIDVGDAEAPVEDIIPLEDDGKRNLKAEAVSLEHMMTHTPYNVHCPSCVRAKMLRRPARRVVHDPAAMPKKFGDLVNADHILLLYMGTARANSKQAQGLSRAKPFLCATKRKYPKAVSGK